MRVAGHTLGTPGLPLPDALALFHEVGLSSAEVIYQDGYAAGIPTGDVNAAKDAARWAASVGVEIIALSPYTTSINSLDPVLRAAGIEELRGCIRAAEIIGAGVIRVYAGAWTPGQPDHAAHWQALVAALGDLAATAADAGVTLCVENHFNTMARSAEETARLIRHVDNAAVRVLYDQANLTFTHDEPYTKALELQGDLISHTHVKDLVFTDPSREFTATETARVKESERAVRSRMVGDGILPWLEILTALAAAGYDGCLSLEYEYRWHPQDLPEPSVGFRESARRLHRLLSAAEGQAR